MKVVTTEQLGCFSIDLEAETIEEAAFITRLGMNGTKLRCLWAFTNDNGSFSAAVVIAKHRRATSVVPKR